MMDAATLPLWRYFSLFLWSRVAINIQFCTCFGLCIGLNRFIWNRTGGFSDLFKVPIYCKFGFCRWVLNLRCVWFASTTWSLHFLSCFKTSFHGSIAMQLKPYSDLMYVDDGGSVVLLLFVDRLFFELTVWRGFQLFNYCLISFLK